MKHLNQIFCTLLLTVAIVVFPVTLNAIELIDQSSNVFKFQQKLADNGNVQAQYKLALMYEVGEGVVSSLDKALYWYDRAAKSGLKKAERRSTYLMVKERGFNKKTHSDWLNSVKTEASDHKPDAMLLLGQLYRQGLGVKKDLKKSLDLLTRVSVLGDADVDNEIESIYAEMSANKNNSKKIAPQKKVKKSATGKSIANVRSVPKTVQKKKPKSVVATKTKTVKKLTEKQRTQAEKVRRYEKAMAQLRLEQELIDKQQADVTGGAIASMDDDF